MAHMVFFIKSKLTEDILINLIIDLNKIKLLVNCLIFGTFISMRKSRPLHLSTYLCFIADAVYIYILAE